MDKSAVAAAGFSSVKRSPRRLIASIQGPVKCGKTRLALTGRKPVGYIAVEIGGEEGVVDQFIEKGQESTDQIQIARIVVPGIEYPDPAGMSTESYNKLITEQVQGSAEQALNAFYAAYYASLENFPTTVVDTGSDLWEIIRLANFGRLEKVPQLAYTQVNKSMDKLIDDAFSFPGSTIFIHHMKEKWETYEENGKQKGRPSGVFEMQGYAGIKKKVQTIIELWREDREEMNEKTGRMVDFKGMIVDSRHNPDAMGAQFENDFSFVDIGMSVFPGTKKKDWE